MKYLYGPVFNGRRGRNRAKLGTDPAATATTAAGVGREEIDD